MSLILNIGGNTLEIPAPYFPQNCDYENACWIKDNVVTTFTQNINNAIIWVNNQDGPLTEKVSETDRLIVWLNAQYQAFNLYFTYVGKHYSNCYNKASKCTTFGVRDCTKSGCNCRTSWNDLQKRYKCCDEIASMMGYSIYLLTKNIEELQQNATEYVEFEKLVASANILIAQQNKFTAETKKVQEEAKIQDFVSKITRYILPGIAILILFYFILRKK